MRRRAGRSGSMKEFPIFRRPGDESVAVVRGKRLLCGWYRRRGVTGPLTGWRKRFRVIRFSWVKPCQDFRLVNKPLLILITDF